MKKQHIRILIILMLCIVAGTGAILLNKREKKELKIETKYCDVYYPGVWESKLLIDEIEGDFHTVTFYANINGKKKQELFSLYFGNVKEPIGAIFTDTGTLLNVSIDVPQFEPDDNWSKEEREIIYAMQDDLNYIIDKLPIVNNGLVNKVEYNTESVPEQTETYVYEDVVVQTPYGMLYLPGEFAEHIEIEHKEQDGEYTVAFSGIIEESQYPLFDICFGVSLEQSIGVLVNGEEAISVDVNLHKLGQDGTCNQEQIEKLMIMQENVGYLLEKMNLSEVVLVTEEDTITESESTNEWDDILIETIYGELYYPGRWKEQIRVETILEPTYSINFYGKVNGKIEQFLFAITYGGNEGYELGMVADSTGENVVIRMVPGELLLDNGWSDEEKDIIYQMQEDVNYIISALGF